MPNRRTIPRLEKLILELRKQESSVSGKVAAFGHAALVRIESHPLVRAYPRFLRRRVKTSYLSEPTIDLDTLFALSLIVHLLLLILLSRVNLTSDIPVHPSPIVVRIETGQAALDPKQAPGRKPSPEAPDRLQQPRPAATPSYKRPTAKERAPVPTKESQADLPRPRNLAEVSRDKAGSVAGEPLESLVQLPTRSLEATEQSSSLSKTDSTPGLSKEPDFQVPAALQRGGGEASNRRSDESRGSALSSPDFAPYLKMIEMRVRSVWKYPDAMTGTHNLSIVFTLDKSGNLTRAEIVDSSDSRLNSSAVQAIKTAAPFPPIPETLSELAGQPLRIKFKVDFGLKAVK